MINEFIGVINMEKEYFDLAINAIRNKAEVEQRYISIKKILELNQMSTYESVCISRILELPEYEHIVLDFIGCDALVDDIGIEMARPILRGYVDKEVIDKYHNWLVAENALRKNINNTISIIRHNDKKGLKKLYNEALSIDIDSDTLALIDEEIKTRNILNNILCYIRNQLREIDFNIKYRKQIKLIESFLNKEKEKSSCA